MAVGPCYHPAMLPILGRYVVVCLLAVAGPVAAWSLAGDDRPFPAADAQEYVAAAPPMQACYRNLTGDRPGCWYLSPTPPGGRLPIPTGKSDPAASAASALMAKDADLIQAAHALVASQVDGAWWYDFSVPFADGSTLRPPWKSASAQGLSLAVLSRAYAWTSDATFLPAIRSAVDAMPVSADGWPQEYPDNSYALSGGLTATLGLWDAWRVTGYSVARDRYQRAVAWLDANLARYDRDFVVLYALGPHSEPSSAEYLAAAETQLQALALISGHQQFSSVADSWDWRRTNPGGFKLLMLSLVFVYHPASLLIALFSLAIALALAWHTTALLRSRPHGERFGRVIASIRRPRGVA
jgi:hypothetical protein